MEKITKSNQIGGISIVSFIVIVAISLSYYQFVYLPAINAKPILPDNILHPASATQVSITEGSSQPSQQKNFDPKVARGTIGASNKVVWTNHDVTAHSVTTDNNYVDAVNGKFDSLATIGLVPPKGTFEFTFTKTGEYLYHCEPHPWMTGKVNIVENFG